MIRPTLMRIQDEDADRLIQGDIPNHSLAGTGKTLSTLEAVKRAGHDRGLVLGPLISMEMWKEQTEMWLGAKAQILRSGADKIKPDTDFVLCPYDLAAGSQRARLRAHFNKGALILDEAHYLRGYGSKRSQAVFGAEYDGDRGFMELFDHVWSLTGNPVWSHSNDMWTQLVALFPKVFAQYGVTEYQNFVRSFCVIRWITVHKKLPQKPKIVASTSSRLLNRIVYHDIGAIRREEALDLPPLTFASLTVKPDRLPKHYADMLSKMTDREIEVALKFSAAGPKEELAGLQGVWQALALSVVGPVVEHIENVSRNSPVLVGVYHTAVGDAYVAELEKRGLSVGVVRGGVTVKKREEIRSAFNQGNLDVIVGQMTAMGVSWNLQAMCHRVVIAQDCPSASTVEQFYKRVQRTGQTQPVIVDTVMPTHPLSLAIARMRRAKGAEQRIVRTGE